MSDLTSAIVTAQKLRENISSAIRGRTDTIDLVLTALFARGHVLIEDYPGSGKTTLAKMLGGSIACTSPGGTTPIVPFRRIQFTPDLLPGDVLGVNVYNPQKNEFFFQPGPVFANIILADEINRTGPKVQAAFLECMAERQVTIDTVTHKLDQLFFVMGTQNPLEISGTYQLPLVQLDRFLLRVPMRYVDSVTEMSILQDAHSIEGAISAVQDVVTRDEVLTAQIAAQNVFISQNILETIVAIVQATRNDSALLLGASTRAALMLKNALCAWALVQGREHVTEDDLKYIAPYVLLHRLRFRPGVTAGNAALQEILAPHLEALVTKAL